MFQNASAQIVTAWVQAVVAARVRVVVAVVVLVLVVVVVVDAAGKPGNSG